MANTFTHQEKHFQTELADGSVLRATVRYDDRCGNGHNTFSITGELYDRTRANGDASLVNSKGKKRYLGSCGCLHGDIAKYFPELVPLIRWHRVSSDGPTHYVANTIFHAERGDFDYARSTAVAPDATPEQLRSEDWLLARLPALLVDFRVAVESLGLKWENVA